MKNVYTFYENNIRELSERVERLRRRIYQVGTIRLLVVIAAGAGLWLFRHDGIAVLAALGTGFFVIFLGLLVFHNRLFWKKDYTETWLRLNENERRGLDYDYSAFDGCADPVPPEHAFAADLDLFGERSLFQAINRTTTFQGKQILSSWLLHPSTDRTTILSRQAAVKELSEQPDLCQKFYVSGKLYKKNQNDADLTRKLMRSPSLFAGKRVWAILLWAFPVAWAIVIPAVALQWVPAAVLAWLTIVCLAIAFSQTKRMNVFHRNVNETEQILHSYSILMRIVESHPFGSEMLRTEAAELSGGDHTASQAVRQLSVYLGKLDQRYNFLMAFLLNVLFLWDIRQAVRIENWKIRYAGETERWLTALGRFDALCSLGTFAFNHPDYIFPSPVPRYFSLQGKGLGHPLMHRERCVRNDIDLPRSPSFLIITGANMAGKSTYLRTVGINYVLACTGAPVFAKSFSFYPATLMTSLRTTDSLTDNESYFFAELKRLKTMIDRLKNGERLFIILDEILKGTNSVDKQKGSLALLKQLISFNTCGIIATHDLVLGSLEKEFPAAVKNYRFEADIADNELTFSYRLRPGIAQNMNACFLMKKMGIGIE